MNVLQLLRTQMLNLDGHIWRKAEGQLPADVLVGGSSEAALAGGLIATFVARVVAGSLASERSKDLVDQLCSARALNTRALSQTVMFISG